MQTALTLMRTCDLWHLIRDFTVFHLSPLWGAGPKWYVSLAGNISGSGPDSSEIAIYLTVTCMSFFSGNYGESSDHESEESSDDDVSIGKRKGRTGSGISLLNT